MGRVIFWYGLIATFIGSLVTALCTWLAYSTNRQIDTFYEAISASFLAGLSGIGIIVQCFLEAIDRNMGRLRAKTKIEVSGE